MKRKKVKYLLYFILLFISVLLIIFIAQRPKNEVFNDALVLTEQEEIELESLQSEEYIMGVINNDTNSEFILSNIGDKFELNYTIQYFSEFTTLLESVENGDIDFASNVTYTFDRSLSLDFTSPVDIESTYLVSLDELAIDNLYGKTVGVPRGSIFDDLLLDNFNDVNIVYYDTYDDFFEMIENGIVDGSVGNTLILEESMQKGMKIITLNDNLPIKPVSIITKLDTNLTLISLFSRYITTSEYHNALITNKKSSIDTIYRTILFDKLNEYYPNQTIDLKIKLENNPPFSYYDLDGLNKGIFADTLFEVCDILDISCDVLNDSNEEWSLMYNDLLTADINVLGPVTKTNDRSQFLNFSTSILQSKYVIINRIDQTNNYDSVSQLLLEKIGVVSGDIKDDYMTNLFPNKELVKYDSNQALIKGLSNGEVDYILFNEFSYYEYILETEDFSISVNNNIGTVFEEEICFAFPNNQDGEQLAEIFSLALELVDTDAIKNNYIEDVNIVSYLEQDTYIQNLIIVIMVMSVTSIIGIIVVFSILVNKLSFRANHDSLTGIYNRRFYELSLKKLDHAGSLPFSIIVADLNGLKLINDAFGHLQGDYFLVSAVSIFKNNTSSKDIVIRIGGDEFCILMPNTSSKDAEKCVVQMIEDSKQFKVNAVQLSISYGVGTKENLEESFQDIYKIAEDSMYRTKLLEIPSMRSNTINSIMNTLFEKDPYSEKHSQSVSLLSELIAKKMGLSLGDISDIKTAGVLHDIGKIIISDDILNCDGKLSKEEFDEMKKHSIIGFRILSSTSELRKLAKIILSHHERWDGLGYPSQLKGEQIPLHSRIITIADAFDAMTSTRKYRDTFSCEEALVELKSCSGTQFDPDLVKIVCDNYDDIVALLSKNSV